jgi:hypothetical protein
MPKHIGIDANYIAGTVTLTNVKVAQVNFTNAAGNPVSFTREPMISLTMLNASTIPPFKVAGIKTGNVFTGFKIGFQTPQTVDIDWTATERG